MSPLLALLLTALVASSAAAGQDPAVAVRTGKAVGERFPDLELPTIDGARTVRLSALRGRRVLLVEFASW